MTSGHGAVSGGTDDRASGRDFVSFGLVPIASGLVLFWFIRPGESSGLRRVSGVVVGVGAAFAGAGLVLVGVWSALVEVSVVMVGR